MSHAILGWTDRGSPLTGASAVAACALFLSAGGATAADCGALAGKTFGDATITAATNVSPPSSVVGKDPPTPVAVNAPFCRVQGSIKPSLDSDIAFEVWLPSQTAWNGKYEGVGNGGFAGSLIYPSRRATRFRARTPAIPAEVWMRPGRLAIPKRSPTSAGERFMRRRRRLRRSSKPITQSRPRIPILPAARMAAAKR